MQAVTTRGARGAIVIALAVIVGVVLLQVVDKGNTGPVGDQSARAAARSTSTTTAPAGGASSTTATTAAAGGRPASQVTVQVLNGSGKSGVAGTLTTQLKGGGYNTLTATDTTHGTGTVIYFQPGFDHEASALATFVPGSQVAQMPSPPPQNASTSANIVVVIGS